MQLLRAENHCASNFFPACLGPCPQQARQAPSSSSPPAGTFPTMKVTSPALALPHMATDINPNPLLGNISIFWVFLQPLASIIGPTTYLSSYSAASQQQLLEQTILKYLFSSEGGLDWVHHPWHKPTAVLQISSGCFLPPNCVDTGFCGVALHSRTGKWNRIEKNLFFLAIATKNWMNANKGVHNGMGMSGCVWKVEMLYTCSAAEVSLEAKNKKVHPKFKLIT